MDETSEPFDEFGHGGRQERAPERGPLASGIRACLRILSFLSLWVAILTVAAVILGHVLPSFPGTFPRIAVKSAIPLIAVGFSYFCLILTLPRTPGQRLVGVTVGLAFILWGVEQFLTNAALVAFIDDVVVFFFVVDLTLVIRHNLQRSADESRPDKAKGGAKEAVSGA